jgi:beta-lactamase superfamily II metal-dependent hydrolase
MWIAAIATATSAVGQHATPEDIKAAQQRIDVLNAELIAISQPLRGPGEIRANVSKTLFDDLNQTLQAMPPSNRSANLTILSAQGTFRNDDTATSGLPFACGYELKLNSMSGNATATLEEIRWASPGTLMARAHVKGDFAANVGLHLNAPPCPDIVCQIGQRRLEWEICVPFLGCYKDFKDVPWPECIFRGWTACDAHCLGGGFQIGSIGAIGRVDRDVSVTMIPSRLEPIDHPVARLYGEKPGTPVAVAATELAVTQQTITDSLTRLTKFKLFDGSGLTDSGKAFAPGAGVGFAFDTNATSQIPIDLDMLIPIPSPVDPFKWFCNNVPGIHEVCKFLNLDPIFKKLTPPDVPVSVNQLITACNLSFCMKNPVEQPAIKVPPPLPGGVPLYGMGDTLVDDPQGPAGSFKVPTSGRPIRAEGFATDLRFGPDGINLVGATNIGWTDIDYWIDRLQTHFIDVGQGDAIWIRMPRRIAGARGDVILIDGGPDDDRGGMYAEHDRLALYLRFFNIPMDGIIDTIVVTHPHRDHYAGLIELVKTAQIRRLIVSGRGSWAPGYHSLIRTARERGIQIVDASTSPIKEDVEGVRFEVLHAYDKKGPFGVFWTATSNASIVARLTYRERSFLFNGDALGRRWGREPEYVERALLKTPGPAQLQATVLKIGDHGSRWVAGADFLRAVDPQVVVIMAGRERRIDGFTPSADTIARVHASLPNATIVTTSLNDEIQNADSDFDGDDIFVVTDGHGMTVWQAEPIAGTPDREWKLRRQVGPPP